MAFHGHTKIELYNVKTGEDKVIEKHNIFTNYLHDIMQILPTPKMTNWMMCGKGSNRYGAVQWGNHNNTNGNRRRITDVLCGGILCLENEHAESADNYLLTKDDVVTARGSCISNSTKDLTLGSYNEELEKSTDTSKTMVWDFSQTQGNGTISTIGLTSIGMGLCGLGGFPTNQTHSSTDPFGDVTLAKEYIFGMTGMYDDDYPTSDPCRNTPLYYSMEKNVLVSYAGYTSSTKILDLRYFYLDSDKINPMGLGSATCDTQSNRPSLLYGVDNSTRYSKTKRVQFDLSSYSFKGASYGNISITNDGYMYFCPHNTYQWTEGSALTFVKIDLMNQKIVGTCEITNTSGVKLELSRSQYIDKTSFAGGNELTYACNIVNGYMLFRTYDSPYRTFAINLENSTDIKEILKEDGTGYSIGRCEMDFSGHKLFQSNGDNANYPLYMVDVHNGVAKCVRTGTVYKEYMPSTTTSSERYPLRMLTSDSKTMNVWALTGSTSSGYYRYENWGIYVTYKQDTLSTINVLDEPVIKTADMTMRITYTISLEEDEG